VFVVGSQPYQDLPAWAAYSDLALLPLQQNGYTRHMFPMKFFEYLAAGLPVVGTAIPALKIHSDVAWLCEPDPVAFSSAIDRALQGQGPALNERLARAQAHTYATRTKSMLMCCVASAWWLRLNRAILNVCVCIARVGTAAKLGWCHHC
jgi:glycosyltransferase involved in cell wall biosynthesis